MSAVIKQSGDGFQSMLMDDIDEIMEIENRVYPFPWTAGIFRDCLRVGYLCWVYRQEGELKSYGVMSMGVGEAHILTVCVKPEAQGQGYGRRMMQHLLDFAGTHHAKKAFLEVRLANDVAIGLYKSMGFQEVGLRKDYYPSENGREDALVMVLELNNFV
ncbi:MAG: ribosomal protein S18-alanine N-acetyltransferase [Gammaproteobacteria bacterium]|nr:ribosomal protein S18-alanine N-acetyltransferase [Gammaproteobacteria bacterium]